MIAYVIMLIAKLLVFQSGYDLFFLMGLPFMAGLWQGSRKWSY